MPFCFSVDWSKKAFLYVIFMSEHILLHVCCGPCAIVPVLRLRAQGHAVTTLFVNPNIHPLSEYLRRREAMEQCAQKLDFNVIFHDAAWDMTQWLADVAGTRDKSPERCSYCYETRLDATAQWFQRSQATKEIGQGVPYTAFSSSLLYSRYQDHAQILTMAEKAAQKFNVPFYYEDFRDEWQKGIDVSKELELYRQPYCGCVYSEAERYHKKLFKYLK